MRGRKRERKIVAVINQSNSLSRHLKTKSSLLEHHGRKLYGSISRGARATALSYEAFMSHKRFYEVDRVT